jgi:hypothetical protein
VMTVSHGSRWVQADGGHSVMRHVVSACRGLLLSVDPESLPSHRLEDGGPLDLKAAR